MVATPMTCTLYVYQMLGNKLHSTYTRDTLIIIFNGPSYSIITDITQC